MNRILEKLLRYTLPAVILLLVMADHLPHSGNGWENYAGFGILCTATYLFILFYGRMQAMFSDDAKVVELNEAWRVRLIKEKQQLVDELRKENPSD